MEKIENVKRSWNDVIKKLKVLFTSFQQVVAPAGLVLKVLKLKCRKFFLNLC